MADVLSRSTVVGTVLKLPGDQLDRPLYASTDKVLKALGGKWDRRAGGHSFPFDPLPKLDEALSSRQIIHRQQKLQLFETPPELAARLCDMIDIGAGDVCLEPSAGCGRIVTAMADRTPDQIIAVEVDQDNAAILVDQARHDRLIVGDFLQQEPSTMRATVVAMNPPFSRNQDIRHVRHAYECLRPGGRLGAIVSEHGFFGQEKECAEWRQWLADVAAHIEAVPAGAFKASGTSVPTRIIIIRRFA
ncbi:hypothetical protein [Sphingomonas sp. 3-13AW]|uniref:hypothetical protein n=1 Tax=Sphingomonas sp. 3-13AW TaxID=3050450 RepID=UPI003BB55FDB